MSFSDIIYATTGAFGWLLIALAVIALGFVLVGYVRTAYRIISTEGWTAFMEHVRVNVLTRRPRRPR